MKIALSYEVVLQAIDKILDKYGDDFDYACELLEHLEANKSQTVKLELDVQYDR